MRSQSLQALCISAQDYVCLSCRLRRVGTVGGGTRYLHASAPSNGRGGNRTTLPEKAAKEVKKKTKPSTSGFRDLIRGFLGRDVNKENNAASIAPPKPASPMTASEVKLSSLDGPLSLSTDSNIGRWHKI